MVEVPDDQGEWRAERAPVPKPGEDLDLVALDLLAGTAPVPLPATFQIGRDCGTIQLQPRRQAGQNPDEGGTVRLTGSREAKVHRRSVVLGYGKHPM